MLALTVALVGPYFVDWTPYRADFEREASRILGREVKVGGTASARLLPFPSVTFSDVVVAGVEPGETAMTVERFSMDAELAPFLRGDVHIFDMRLVRPAVTLDIGDDGSVDWAVRPSVPIGAAHISLERLTVTEGKVSIRHAESGRTHQLTEVNADISARALTGPWRMDGSLRIDGMLTDVAVSTGSVDDAGGMRLRVRAVPKRYPLEIELDGTAGLDDRGLRYAGQFRLNAAPGGEGFQLVAALPTPGKEKAPPAYRLSGRFDIDHARIDVPEFRLETGQLDDPYTAEGTARFDLGAEPRFSVRADGAQIRFDDDEAAGQGGGVSLDRRLAAFRAFMLDMPRPAIPGRVEVRLPAIVAGDTTIRNVHLLAEPAAEGWKVASIGATLPGRTTLEADGLLSVDEALGFEGSLLLAVGQPSGFAAWLSRDVDQAIRRLPAAGFSAKVSLGEERQAFSDLELVLGEAKFSGEIVNRSPAGQEPSMALRLDGDRLDVEGMAAFASLFVSDSGEARLADRDVEFEITAGPVVAAGLTADTLDTALRLKDGRLEIDRLSIGGLAGANIGATGSIKGLGAAPSGALDATVIAADLEPLARALAERFPGNTALAEVVRRAEAYPGLISDASFQIVASSAAEEDASGIALSATGEAGGTALSLTASADRLSADWMASPVKVELSARNDEAAALYGAAGLLGLPIGLAGGAQAELRFEGAPGEGGDTSVRVLGDDFELTFDGSAGMPGGVLSASGSARIETADLEPWLATGGVALPGMGFGLPVSLASTLDIDEGLLVLSGMEGEIAGSAVSGDLNARMREGLPHLTGDLSVDVLDLVPVAQLVAGADAFPGEAGGWPTAPFAQSVTAPLTTELDLAARKLSFGSFATASDARLTLRLNRDGASLSDASASLFGGRVEGIVDFRNDAGTGLLSGQFQLTDVAIPELVGDLGIDGRADVGATLTASGKSVDGIVSALAGSGTAQARGLTIAGINPDALAPLLAKADTFGPDIDAAATSVFAPEIVWKGVFAAGDAELAFTVAGGRLRAPPLRLETEEATVTAEVTADFGERSVGAEATVTYAPGPEALVGSEPTVRLVAGGPPGDIGVLVDTEPLAQFLTQRALELEQRRVEAMQAALLEKQRHRREVRYYAALTDERDRTAEAARREAEEQERLERELRAMEQEEARRAAAEAARIAEEQRQAAEEAQRAEDEARRAAERLEEQRRREEEARRQREEQSRLEQQQAERQRAEEAEQARLEEAERQEAERRRAEEDRLRAEDDRLRAEVEAFLNAPDEPSAPSPAAADEDEIERQPLAPPDVVNVTPQPAPRGEPLPPPQPPQPAAAAEPDRSGIFSRENLSLDGLLRALGRNP